MFLIKWWTQIWCLGIQFYLGALSSGNLVEARKVFDEMPGRTLYPGIRFYRGMLKWERRGRIVFV